MKKVLREARWNATQSVVTRDTGDEERRTERKERQTERERLASAMKINAWSCALATDRDLESGLSKSINVRPPKTVNDARRKQKTAHTETFWRYTRRRPHAHVQIKIQIQFYTHWNIQTHVTDTYHTYHTCHTLPHMSHITRRPPYHHQHTHAHTPNWRWVYRPPVWQLNANEATGRGTWWASHDSEYRKKLLSECTMKYQLQSSMQMSWPRDGLTATNAAALAPGHKSAAFEKKHWTATRSSKSVAPSIGSRGLRF